MRIVTDQKNPWNDNKEHFAIPLHRFGDNFFVYEETEENTGTEFPIRLDGATYGKVLFLIKDEYGLALMLSRLGQVRESIQMLLEALEEKRRQERKEENGQQV